MATTQASFRPSLQGWGILFAALLLRLIGIASEGLWNDEGHSYLLARLPLREFFPASLKFTLCPPLFELLLKPLIALFPGAPWVIRIPGLIASLAAIYLVYCTARYLKNETAARLAAGLFAVSPLSVFFVHEGRAYTLLSFFYLGAVLCQLDFLKTSRKRSLLGGALCGIFLGYLHSIGPILWGCSNILFLLAWGFRNHERPKLNLWIAAQAGVMGLIVIYLPFVMTDLRDFTKEPSIYQLFWEKNSSWKVLIQATRNLLPGDFSPQSHLPLPHLTQGSWIVSAVFIATVLLARPWKQKNRSLVWLFLATYLPLLAFILISDFYTAIYWLGRTESIVTACFFLFLGCLIADIELRSLRLASAAIFVVAGAVSLLNYHFSGDYPRKQWDARAAREFLQHEHPTHAVVDVRTRFSFVGTLLALAPDLKIIPYPSSSPTAGTHTTDLYRFLEARANPPAANAAAILEDLKNQRIHDFALIHVASLEANRWTVEPSTPAFIQELHQRHCQVSHAPEIFPMDWHDNGFHVSRNIHCPFLP